MSRTDVYGCDWCKEIVPKKKVLQGDFEQPDFAAFVTMEGRGAYKTTPQEYDICASCRRALLALTEGKFRR